MTCQYGYIRFVIVKPIVWMGSSLADTRSFNLGARREVGHELHLVQTGLEPSDWKPMPSVGHGVIEIRVHTHVEHRVIYIAKFAEAIYVLHAFQKTSRKTAQSDLELARKRLQVLASLRDAHSRGTHED